MRRSSASLPVQSSSPLGAELAQRRSRSAQRPWQRLSLTPEPHGQRSFRSGSRRKSSNAASGSPLSSMIRARVAEVRAPRRASARAGRTAAPRLKVAHSVSERPAKCSTGCSTLRTRSTSLIRLAVPGVSSSAGAGSLNRDRATF